MNKNIKGLITVFCLTLGLTALSSVKVYAGGPGGVNSAQGTSWSTTTTTKSKEQSGLDSNGNIVGSQQGSTTNKKPTTNTSSDKKEEPPKPKYYDPSDDYNWKDGSLTGYYESDSRYIVVETQTRTYTTTHWDKTTYDWKLYFKQKVDDAEGLKESKVDHNSKWAYHVLVDGYYRMTQIPTYYKTDYEVTRTDSNTFSVKHMSDSSSSSDVDAVAGAGPNSMTDVTARVGREVSEGTPKVLKEYTVQGSLKQWMAYLKEGQTITGDGGSGGGGTETSSQTVDINTESSLIK